MAGSNKIVVDEYADHRTDASKSIGVLGSNGVNGTSTRVSGYISQADHDMFQVYLTPGYYTIRGLAVDSNPLPSTSAISNLYIGDFTVRSALSEGKVNSIFEITTQGWYYIDAFSTCYLCTGNYAFDVVSVDFNQLGIVDVPGGANTTATLSVGAGKTSAAFNVDNDTDAYRVELVEGKTYYFMLDGNRSTFGAGVDTNGLLGYHVINPTLSLYGDNWATAGAAALLETGDDTQGSRDAMIEYTVPAGKGGTYYLQASGKGRPNTGDYLISAIEHVADDWVDYAAQKTSTLNPNRTLATLVINDSPTVGTIGVPGDNDVFAVKLTAGVSYMLRAEAFGTTGRPLGNPLLFLLDKYEKPIYYNDDKSGDPLGAGSGAQRKDSLIIYTPTETQTFYLAVQGIGNTMGQYKVSVAAVDDVVGTTATTQRLFVNAGNVQGQIEIPGDSDWYSIYLSAGATYVFDARSAVSNPLSNPLLYLRDANGVALAVNDDDNGLNSQIRFTAITSGMYFLDVQDATRGTGNYTVSAQASDDHAASVGTTSVIDLAATNNGTGRIDFGGDVDWMAVDLVFGTTYAINVIGAGTGGGLTLVDPRLHGIYDANGVLVHNSGNDDYGNGRDAFVEFRAPATGRYYLAVAGSTLNDLGSYRVLLTQQSIPDVAASNLTRATLNVGEAVAGAIEANNDADWYSVQLEAGQTYVIDLLGDVSSTSILRDAVLGGIYRADGSLISGTSNNNYGASLNSKMLFTPTTSGTYFIEAKGNTGHTGDYLLSIKNLAATTDAVGSSVTSHGQITLTNGSAVINGTVDVARDVDWYQISLQQGHAYEITVRGAASGMGSLLDSRLNGIYDAAGKLIMGTGADGGDGGVDVRSTFMPSVSGTYYLSVGGGADMSGNYRVEVRETTATNDVASNALTSAVVTSGAAYYGQLETVGDSDWIRVDLKANQQVTLSVDGVTGSLGKVINPEIANIFNARGEAVLLDPYKATTSLDKKTFLSTEAGTYYVQVQSYTSSLGNYRLMVSEAVDDHRQGKKTEVPAPELLGSFIDHKLNSYVDTTLVNGENPRLNYYSTNIATDGVITLNFGVSDAYEMDYITMPVDMAKGSGYIYLSSANQLLKIDVNSDQVQIYGNTVVINPDANFLPNTDYALFMDAGVLTDTGGVAFQGIGVERESMYWGMSLQFAEVQGNYMYAWKTSTIDDPNEFLFRTAAAPVSAKDDWTIMVYMAADNELEAQAIADLKEMFAAQLPDNVNVVVMVDRADGYDSSEGNWTSAYKGLVVQGMTVADIAKKWESIGEVDTGNSATLTDFIGWAKTNYAAEHYGLVVWGPGGGITGTAWDYSANMSNLTLNELNSALTTAGLSDTAAIAQTNPTQQLGYEKWDSTKFGLIDAQLSDSGNQIVLSYSRAVYNMYEYNESVEAIRPFIKAFKYSLDNGATWKSVADWSVKENNVTLDLGMAVDSGTAVRVQYDANYRPVYENSFEKGYGEWYTVPGQTTKKFSTATTNSSSLSAADDTIRPAEFAAIRSDTFDYSDGLPKNQWTSSYLAPSFDITLTDNRLDLLAFDSSTMGLAETVWQVARNTQTVVASQDAVPATGFDYTNWLQSLSSNVEVTGNQLAHELVDTYFAQNAGGLGASIAAYDTASLTSSYKSDDGYDGYYISSRNYYETNNTFIYDLNKFADYALKQGTSDEWKIIREAARVAMSSPTHDVVVDYYRDLSDFLSYLNVHLPWDGSNEPIDLNLRDYARTLYSTVVNMSTYSKTVDSGSVGLGIYMPLNAPVDSTYIDSAAGAAGTSTNFLFLSTMFKDWVNNSGWSLVDMYPQWDEFVLKLQAEVINTAPTNLTIAPLATTGAAGHVIEAVGADGHKLIKDLKVATLSYTDTDGWTNTNMYELSGPDADKFITIGDALYLKAGTVVDYEDGTNTDHAFSVSLTVKDPALVASTGINPTQSFTVTIDNGDESAPIMAVSANVVVSESTAINPLIYTAVATDDIGIARYSLKGVGDYAAFDINAVTGAVSFKGALDYETRDLYQFTVVAEDAVGNRAEQQVNFKVRNVDDGGIDTRGPVVTGFSPADNKVAVALNNNVVVSFNEAIKLGSGNIVLKTLSGTDVQTFSASATTGLMINNADAEHATLTLNPTAQLNNNTMYIVAFEANSVLDLSNNPMATAITDYNFRTIGAISGVATAVDDTTGASVNGLVLANGATAQSVDGDIVLQLSESVQRGSGSVQLIRHYNGAPDQVVETFDIASSDRLSLDSITGQLTIDPSSALQKGTSYSVVIDSNALLDAAGNPLVSGGNDVAFTVANTGGFDIELVFEGTSQGGVAWTDALKKPYLDAVAKLEAVIVGDLPDVRDANGNLIADDLVIHVYEGDLPTQMGVGGPSAFRSGADGGLAYSGNIQMDRVETSTIAESFATPELRLATIDAVMSDVIMHEVSHALGIGTLWGNFGFNSVRGQYTGENALDVYREMINNPNAAFVPLDMSGQGGTDNAHWDEEIFGQEYMTGFFRSPGMKVSELSLAALEDLGYEVNHEAADGYSVMGSVVLPAGPILNASNTGQTSLYMDHAVI